MQLDKDKLKAYGLLLYKIENKSIKLLLCKSVKSKEKWGCLKGMQQRLETEKQCARREFFEECGIKVNIEDFEDYFYQKNKAKDIGIWLVNAKKIENLKKYFDENTLDKSFLSKENQEVKFFDINKLPKIKKKQKSLMKSIKGFLQNKHQHH